MPGSEASEITGPPVGAITPLCLGSTLPVFLDIGLKRFEEVVTAGGSPGPRGSMSAKRCKRLESALGPRRATPAI